MSAETIALLAAGYLAVLIVAWAMFAAAGQADRREEAARERDLRAGEARADRDADPRFAPRRGARELARAGRRGPPRDR